MSSKRNDDLSLEKMAIHRKIVLRSSGGGYKIYMDSASSPFSQLRASDFLDTSDLCMLFGTSARTIYRWMSERGLRWDRKVGREYLFRKDDVLDWWEQHRPPLGRPPVQRDGR